MSDSVAQDQIKAFVDRIMRLREEERAIKADIREIYAEAKGNGFDKTILGKLVNYVEKRSTKGAELAEHEAIFDLYLTAYDSASGKVGTRNAHAHTHDPETGEITEPATAPVVVESGEGKDAPLSATQSQAKASAGNGATEQAIEAPADSVSGEAIRLSGGSGTAEAGESPATPSLQKTQRTVQEPLARIHADPLRSDAAPRKDAGTAAPDPAPRNSRGLRYPEGCERPEACGSSSWRHRCHACEQAFAHDDASVVA